MLIRCRDCHWCDDRVVEENGEKDVKPYCEKMEQFLPDYDYEPENGCFWFRFSSDAMREYAE